MLEAAYEYGKVQGESTDPILGKVTHIKNSETTYMIFFNIDDKTLDLSETKKFSTKHPEKYLYITESGNVPYYSPSTINLGNITGYIEKKKKDGTIELNDKKTIIGSLAKQMNFVLFQDDINIRSIIDSVLKIFYSEKKILKKGKEEKILALNNEYYEQIVTINDKLGFYTIGFIKDNKKFLLAELREYKNFLKEYKFGGKDQKREKIEKHLYVCDFCGKEKELVSNFGKTNPYKLASLKMFGSTYIKGFYSIDNSDKNLFKTIRCCPECIRMIQNTDNYLSRNHYVTKLTPVSLGKGKSKNDSIHVYLFTRKILGFKTPEEIELIIDIVKIIFGERKQLDAKLSAISTIIDKLSIGIDDFQDASVDLFFEITDGKQKHQIIHEARNLSVTSISDILKKLNIITEIRKMLIPNSERHFDLRYIFELISLFNYKVSVDVIKSFFLKRIPLKDVILKGMLKQIRSANFDSYPEKLGYLYKPLTLDLSLTFSFIELLNREDHKMEIITKELVLDENEEKRLRAKPIRTFVEKIYIGLTQSEISLMEIGEIIHDISSELYLHGKKDREKIFLSKIDYTGMSKEDIEKLIVFINGKVSQYHTDLKYIAASLAEKLNQVTIEINNYTIDKIRAVLRIVDGYNLKKRISIMAATLNKEVIK